MKINILGTDYEIIEQTAEENHKLDDNNGICEQWSKKIIIDSNILKPHKLLVEQPELYKNKVLRHEIIHAFFHESGLSEYRNDETLVDYLAMQLPKIVKLMQGAGCWDK